MKQMVSPYDIANMALYLASPAGATVTGDSIGQVASQTLPNLAAVYDAAEPPVLSPLIAMNKMDIVDIAKRIGTFDASVMPGSDCCSEAWILRSW